MKYILNSVKTDVIKVYYSTIAEVMTAILADGRIIRCPYTYITDRFTDE